MSVAFRRESDEEHKEPRFELPIPPGPNLVTAYGLAMIEAKVAEFRAAADAAGDDALREAAKRDLRYWSTRLATAQLAPPPPPGEVAFGARVAFRLAGSLRTIDIVGDDEAEPAAGRIAFSAPLVRAMMGLCEGDFADFGGRADAVEIMAVEPIPA